MAFNFASIPASRTRSQGLGLLSPAASGRYSGQLLLTSASSVSTAPMARRSSVKALTSRGSDSLAQAPSGGSDGVRETTKLTVDQLKGHVFLNQYLVIKDIGRGMHGTVKLVYNTQDEMMYACKVVKYKRLRRANRLNNTKRPTPSPANQEDDLQTEMAVMKALAHPNVVRLYEVIQDREHEKLLMIMEYVEGGSVLSSHAVVDNELSYEPLLESVALRYFRDVVKGLEYLHFNRIVHGDLKPDNLILTHAAGVKISDFGSAKFLKDDNLLHVTNGTPFFFSPEMCSGTPFDGFAADVWALGVCLYVFVCGQMPFSAKTGATIYDAIRTSALRWPSGVSLSRDLQDLLTRMLAKDPTERLTLEQVSSHSWFSQHGSMPAFKTSTQRRCSTVYAELQSLQQKGDGPLVEPSAVPLRPMPLDFKHLLPLAEERTYTDGQSVVEQGQPPEGLFVIVEGLLELYHMPRGRNTVPDHDFADQLSDDSREGSDDDEEPVWFSMPQALSKVSTGPEQSSTPVQQASDDRHKAGASTATVPSLGRTLHKVFSSPARIHQDRQIGEYCTPLSIMNEDADTVPPSGPDAPTPTLGDSWSRCMTLDTPASAGPADRPHTFPQHHVPNDIFHAADNALFRNSPASRTDGRGSAGTDSAASAAAGGGGGGSAAAASSRPVPLVGSRGPRVSDSIPEHAPTYLTELLGTTSSGEVFEPSVSGGTVGGAGGGVSGGGSVSGGGGVSSGGGGLSGGVRLSSSSGPTGSLMFDFAKVSASSMDRSYDGVSPVRAVRLVRGPVAASAGGPNSPSGRKPVGARCSSPALSQLLPADSAQRGGGPTASLGELRGAYARLWSSGSPAAQVSASGVPQASPPASPPLGPRDGSSLSLIIARRPMASMASAPLRHADSETREGEGAGGGNPSPADGLVRRASANGGGGGGGDYTIVLDDINPNMGPRKLQRFMSRTDSMHRRMKKMVENANQCVVPRMRDGGGLEYAATRGVGSVVGELTVEGRLPNSTVTAVAKGDVKVLLIKADAMSEAMWRNKPQLRATINRMQGASLVQAAMERFAEYTPELEVAERIRDALTTTEWLDHTP